MDRETVLQHKLVNGIQTLLLIGGMGLVLAVSAELLFGRGVWPWVFALVVAMLLVAPRLSPAVVLRLYGAQPLHPRQAPRLTALVEDLARRAGLPRSPVLYYIPTRMMNAFTVGTRDEAALAVTDGLLQRLSLRELAGVLAHETSHVRNNDMWVMGLADTVGRLTQTVSLFGQLLILVNLPLFLFSDAQVPWGGILLLVFAPTISALLQLALSRTREFDADLEAARLTGDPRGLASALQRLERYQGNLFERILLPGRRNPNPSLLRTHPPTEERVARLLALEEGPRPLASDWDDAAQDLYVEPPRVTRRPSHHLFGFWH